MIDKINRLFEMFPDAQEISMFEESSSGYNLEYLGKNVKWISFHYRTDNFKTHWLINGYVNIHYDIETRGFSYEFLRYDNGDDDMQLCEDDAKFIVLSCIEILYKTNCPTRDWLKIEKTKYNGRTKYLITVPRIEFDCYYADDYNWNR